MGGAPFVVWVRDHRWALLLLSVLALLVISPFAGVYDRNDNFISPLVAMMVSFIIVSTARGAFTIFGLLTLTVVWLAVAIFTDGSGLFAGQAVAAPILFLIVMGMVFLLLVFWLSHIHVITAETLCAALCGYLILGLFWTGIYALLYAQDSHSFLSLQGQKVEHGDLLCYSYSDLTTSGSSSLTANNRVVHIWAVIEPVIGIFYNAVVIARLVSLYGFGRQPATPAAP